MRCVASADAGHDAVGVAAIEQRRVRRRADVRTRRDGAAIEVVILVGIGAAAGAIAVAEIAQKTRSAP